MREAPVLAGVTGPRSRPGAGSRSRKPNPKQGWKSSLLGRAFARPGVTICGAAFAALMTGIVANAVLFQKGHHPAPLFKAEPAPVALQPAAPLASQRVAEQPAAPPPPAAVSELTPPLATAPVPVSPPIAAPPVARSGTTLKGAKVAKVAAKAHRQPDAIGSLLSNMGASGAPAKPVKKASPTPSEHGHTKAAAGKNAPVVAKDGVAPHV